MVVKQEPAAPESFFFFQLLLLTVSPCLIRTSIIQFRQESGASTKKEKQAAVTSDKSHSDSDATCQRMSVRKSVAPHGTELVHSLQVDHEDSAVASFMDRLVMVCDYSTQESWQTDAHGTLTKGI